MSDKQVPARWATLMDVLQHHPGYHVTLWFNKHGGGGTGGGGFTAQVRDDRGGFAPPGHEGHIWSVFRPDAVGALDDLARLVHEAVLS